MSSEIKPSDVYEKVLEVYSLIWWLFYLVMAVFIMNVVKLVNQLVTDYRIRRGLDRVEKLLTMIEKHGELSGRQLTKAVTQVREAADEIKASGSGVIKGAANGGA